MKSRYTLIHIHLRVKCKCLNFLSLLVFFRNHFKVSKEFKQLNECLIREYEEEGDLMKYAYLLVELSTISGKDYKKRQDFMLDVVF